MPSKCKLLFDVPYLLLAPGLQGPSKSFQLDGDALKGAADRYRFIPRELYGFHEARETWPETLDVEPFFAHGALCKSQDQRAMIRHLSSSTLQQALRVDVLPIIGT